MHALIITEQGMQLSVEGGLFVVSRAGKPLRRARAVDIDQVLLCGRIEITSAAVSLIARRGIDLAWLTADGRFRARLATRASRNVALRLAQYGRAFDQVFCLHAARSLVRAKIQQQRELLLRAQRRLKDPSLATALGQLRMLADRAGQEQSLDALRGVEGQAAALYFAHFGKLLRTPDFTFSGRNRRPPRDPVNACLSFGYALLGTTLETELLRAGLDPLLGFFHQPHHGRASLMLDLLEAFRPTIDALTLRLLNRRQLAPSDFDRMSGQTLEQVLGGPDDVLPARDVADAVRPAAESPGSAAGQILPPGPAGGELAAEQPTFVEAGIEPVDLAAIDDEVDGVPVGVDDPLAVDDAVGASGEQPQPHAGSGAAGSSAAGVVGVYLGEAGRRIYLAEYFKRLRETQMYAPRGQVLGFREILREQVYHLARVIEGRDPEFRPFTSSLAGGNVAE